MTPRSRRAGNWVCSGDPTCSGPFTVFREPAGSALTHTAVCEVHGRAAYRPLYRDQRTRLRLSEAEARRLVVRLGPNARQVVESYASAPPPQEDWEEGASARPSIPDDVVARNFHGDEYVPGGKPFATRRGERWRRRLENQRRWREEKDEREADSLAQRLAERMGQLPEPEGEELDAAREWLDDPRT